MFKWTNTLIVNSNLDSSGKPKWSAQAEDTGSGVVGSFEFKRVNKFLKPNVVAIYKKEASDPVLGKVTFTMSNQGVGNYRVALYIRLSGSQNSYYSNDFVFKGKPLMYEFAIKNVSATAADVAKEAADVILTDDNFATVVSAVEEGRRIYDNIIKAIQFLLSSNVGEVIVLFLAILLTPFLATKFGIPIGLIEPLLPIHILWINLVTDSLPALALAFDPANKDVMERKPVKASSGIFTKGMTWRIIYQGIMIGLLSLAAFVIGISTPNPPVIEGLTPEQVRVEIGQTMTFIVLAFSELIHVFNIRNNKESIFKIGIGGNKQLFWAIGASAMLMLVILAIPGLRAIFSIPVLPMDRIVETIALVIAPIVIVEIFKLLKINTSKDE